MLIRMAAGKKVTERTTAGSKAGAAAEPSHQTPANAHAQDLSCDGESIIDSDRESRTCSLTVWAHSAQYGPCGQSFTWVHVP